MVTKHAWGRGYHTGGVVFRAPRGGSRLIGDAGGGITEV